MNQTCGECTAYRPGPRPGYGICCAAPPTAILLGINTDALGHQIPVSDSFYPPVRLASLQCRDGFVQRNEPPVEIGAAEGSA